MEDIIVTTVMKELDCAAQEAKAAILCAQTHMANWYAEGKVSRDQIIHAIRCGWLTINEGKDNKAYAWFSDTNDDEGIARDTVVNVANLEIVINYELTTSTGDKLEELGLL